MYLVKQQVWGNEWKGEVMFQLRWIDSVKAIGKATGAAERGPVRAADQAWRMNGFPRPGCQRGSLLCTARGENVLEPWEAGVGQPRDQAAGTAWEPARGPRQAQEVAPGMLCGSAWQEGSTEGGGRGSLCGRKRRKRQHIPLTPGLPPPGAWAHPQPPDHSGCLSLSFF